MNTLSHVTLGEYILDFLTSQYGLELHRSSFLMGNILPDCQLSFMTRPHQAEYWQEYLHSLVEKLLQEKADGRRFSRLYSLRLGVLCHFYTDFFCYTHNAAFSGTSREHLRYEWDIHRRLQKGVLLVPSDPLDVARCRNTTPEIVSAVFQKLHREYTENIGPSEGRDIRYTLRACVDAVSRIALCSAALEPKQEGHCPAPAVPAV